ncbi:uncharacterized protein LOC121993209 isoform X2 [Zingiber officinale]|uniref:uncharacterized protein LOC121993209 isoform X2 n=1 Tax=Zingiber officinale TaxID=94328 RepID=UPI001C4BAE99|nr:uncharacterized protein LOC121993209 isoform X2 [Zingiber officinale]
MANILLSCWNHSAFHCNHSVFNESERFSQFQHQEEVGKPLNQTQVEMNGALQSGGHSQKTLNTPTSSQQLKSASDNVESSGTSPHVKGKKRLRNDQIVEPIKGDQTTELVKKDLHTETIKREQFSKVGDGGFVTFKFDNINTEINKISDKGGLVSTEGVENLVSLMQLDITEKKIDLAGRIILVDVITVTEKSDFLNKFVQLRGVPVLDEWLQEVHKGKTDNGSNPHESEKLVEEFLLSLLRALEKLPINLHALQICNIGKSVNNLRSHKNMEIQKRARGLVDTWKKRVDAEMSKISDGKFVASGQPASFSMKPGHSDVTQAGNKRTGSIDAAGKISITRPSAGKALPSKHGITDSNKKPIVLAPLVASSKDLHCKTAAGSGVSILSFPTVKEEKSIASSPSQSNSHSCSSDQVKTMTSSWKEEAMSSVVGSGNASKLIGSMNRSRRSSNGLLVTNVSGNLNETHAGKCMSVNKVMTAAKTLQGEKPLDIPVDDHGNISTLIVRFPNTGRSPGKSDSGGSLEDQLVTSGKSSPVGISDKNDLNDGKLKLKNDVPLYHTTDVNTAACQGNDVNEGLSGIEEHRRNAEVTAKLADPARTACLSGNENGTCWTEPRANSYNSMLALVESCAEYSESANPLAAGDDMGMNLLATVAAGEISRSNIITPIDSLGSPRAVEEQCTGNDVSMLGLSCDDDMAERNTPHDESANSSSEKKEKKVDCVLASDILQTDNKLTSKSANSTQLQTTQSTITCMSSLDNLDSENTVVKSGEERIDEPEPEEGDSIGADPIKDKQTTDVQISGICTYIRPNFTGPLKDENTSFERNCKIEDNNNMCFSDVKAGNKFDIDVSDSGRKLEAPVVEEHTTSQVVKKPSSSSSSTENLLKSSSLDSEISLPAVSMPSLTAINESNVLKSNNMEISPLELSCEAKEKNIPPPSTDELVVSAAVSRVTAEILENLKEANESRSAESSAIQEALSTKIKETENSEKSSRSFGIEEMKEEDHASSLDRCSSIVFAEQVVVTRLQLDLNEGIPVDEGNQGKPVISSTISASSVHMPCQSLFSISMSTNLPASVTVAAPAKGPFVPPEVLFKTKGQPGWKGSAATSAFRPAEPWKASNILDTLPSDGAGKKSHLLLHIDLNIADEDVEDQMAGITTANDFPTKNVVGVDLDLNKVDDSVKNGQFLASTNRRLELPLLHIQSASGGLPAGKANVLRNFDLNDRPGIDEIGTEMQPRCQQANYANIVPSLAPVSGHRTNNLEPGYASSSFCPNSYPGAVPSFLPDRGEQFNLAVAAVESHRISGSLCAGNLGNDIYQGLALSSSPATTFPFANVSCPSTFSRAPASSLSGGSIPYVDSSSGGGSCFPAYPSLLVGPVSAVSSHYPRPYMISFPEGSTGSLSRQGLDLNTGPGSGYLEGKEGNLPSSSRYLLPASSQIFMENQTRMHGVPGVGSKRKEPEGSWGAERPTERSAKHSPWK